MADTEVYVFAHLPEGFVPAGRLTLTEEGTRLLASRYAYGLRYLERRHRFDIDPVSLSLENEAVIKGMDLVPASGLEIFGGIRDAAPDAWGRRVIEVQRQAPADSLPESVYLLEAGANRVGALDVRPAIGAPPLKTAGKLRTLGNLLDMADRVDAGLPVPASLAGLLDAGSAMGGARPKAGVVDDEGLLWIAKFPRRDDRYDMSAAEHLALFLGRRCGLDVPRTRLVNMGDRNVLLVRRFDRYWLAGDELPAQGVVLHDTEPGRERTERRLPFVSALTLLACTPMESPARSYADLAQAMRRYNHPARLRADLAELFARMVLNVFVSNDDDHLRNHGFVRDPRLPGWRLSPLYDVVPRPGIAQDRFLHLGVGAKGKLATLDNALSWHAAFMPSREEALTAMHRVWSVMRQWRTIGEELGIPAATLDTVSSAMRDLDDICSPEVATAIRRAAP